MSYKPRVGERVRAFHPGMLGVVKTGTVIKVGRKYAQIDFGPLADGVRAVPFKYIVAAD
jgi:hypothetical protein